MDRIREKFRLRRLCISHFKGWQVYVKRLLDYGILLTPLLPINRFTLARTPFRPPPTSNVCLLITRSTKLIIGSFLGRLPSSPEAKFLDEIQTKGFSSLLIHCHVYSFALRFLFLQTHATSYYFYTKVTVHCTVKKKGGKPERKAYLLPYVLRNPYRNLMSENSQDCARKPQRNCTFMNSDSGPALTKKPAIFGHNQRQLRSKKTKINVLYRSLL
jgi:hypothetical protein